MSSEPFEQPAATAGLRGNEAFVGIDAQVLDFWRFAMSDLRMNNTRGYLAEFLVARALGLQDVHRVEWEAYDLLFEGISVEVKSSALLQAWPQQRHSRLSFGGLRTGPRGSRTLNADVYVFCTQTSVRHSEYDPLDLTEWTFHVVSRTALDAAAGDSIGLAGVERVSQGATPWAGLADAVREAHRGSPER
ncbi:hypothetical protein EDF22_2817 [Rathayibacter sp. PhB127]|uniref:hypothetical protein n=1 Tax=Rathayibacter sp. PhB127 TaxID=2485176 RepID=UPI000F4C91D2|nr:hypothetical protein [Rathayibacter sp. PhB127]ROS25603.1 hypothetical protein EDF22_2817 [Rathayibacter sp. PhB127]